MEIKSNGTSDIPEYLPSLGRLLNFATNALNRYCQHRLAEHDLTLPQWVILSALWREDGLLVNDLARYSGTNAPAASRIIDRMAENGTLRRQSDKSDGRAVRVYLTKQGRSLEGLVNFYQEVNEVFLKGFTQQESRQLFTFMERILENASASTHSPSDDGEH